MNNHDTTRYAADLFSMMKATPATPAASSISGAGFPVLAAVAKLNATPAAPAPAQPPAWVGSVTEEEAAAALTRAGFKVTPVVDKYGVKRWEFIDTFGKPWMLSREKFLKTGWLYRDYRPRERAI